MAKNKIEVICITDKDCPRNQEFDHLLSTVENGRRIDFYTQDMEDLSIIAKYRVLPVPTFLFLNNSRMVGRIVHPPNAESMAEILSNMAYLFK